MARPETLRFLSQAVSPQSILPVFTEAKRAQTQQLKFQQFKDSVAKFMQSEELDPIVKKRGTTARKVNPNWDRSPEEFSAFKASVEEMGAADDIINKGEIAGFINPVVAKQLRALNAVQPDKAALSALQWSKMGAETQARQRQTQQATLLKQQQTEADAAFKAGEAAKGQNFMVQLAIDSIDPSLSLVQQVPVLVQAFAEQSGLDVKDVARDPVAMAKIKSALEVFNIEQAATGLRGATTRVQTRRFARDTNKQSPGTFNLAESEPTDEGTLIPTKGPLGKAMKRMTETNTPVGSALGTFSLNPNTGTVLASVLGQGFTFDNSSGQMEIFSASGEKLTEEFLLNSIEARIEAREFGPIINVQRDISKGMLNLNNVLKAEIKRLGPTKDAVLQGTLDQLTTLQADLQERIDAFRPTETLRFGVGATMPAIDPTQTFAPGVPLPDAPVRMLDLFKDYAETVELVLNPKPIPVELQ